MTGESRPPADAELQWGAVFTAHALNLLLVFVVVAAILTLTGYHDPFHSPSIEIALRKPVAVSNPIAFALIYIASLTWKLSDEAIELRLAVRHRKDIFNRLISLILASAIFVLAAFCMIFFVGLFFTFGPAVLLTSICCNSFLLHFLLSRRSLKARIQN